MAKHSAAAIRAPDNLRVPLVLHTVQLRLSLVPTNVGNREAVGMAYF